MFCEICKQDIKYDKVGQFSQHHLIRNHGVTPKEYYDRYIKSGDEGRCGSCGNEAKFISLTFGYRSYCTKKCYGKSDDYRNKIIESFKRRDKESEKRKRAETCLKKYGVEYSLKCPEVRNKSIETNIRKYGHKTNLLTEECYNARWKSLTENKDIINAKRRSYWTEENIDLATAKRKQTCLQKYGV